jgi:hypothetical protein
MAARGALEFHEVARAKVFDPSGVERHHRWVELPVCSIKYHALI